MRTRTIAGLTLTALGLTLALSMPSAAQAQRRTLPSEPRPSASAPPARSSAPAAKPATPASAADPEYVLGPGDVLAIDVYHEPDLTRSLPVRPDGRLSLPLVGELVAQGKTALQLQSEITAKLRAYIDSPSVTVMVQDAESQRFNILGMVQKPGSYPLAHPTTILDALAEAGGLRDFAHGNKIYLIRKRASDGVEIRYNFNYKQVSLGLHPEENIPVQANDIIVVP